MAAGGGELLIRIGGLAAQPGLVHGFSTLALGCMRGVPGDPTGVTPRRRGFAEALGLQPDLLCVAGAVHGSEVARVDAPAGVVRGCDGLVTDRPGLALLATFADCYPVLLFDPERRALALAHAGWRGTAAAIAQRCVEALTAEFGTRPADIVAGIGPGICGDCYEVGDEVARCFDPAVVRPSPSGRHLLDLASTNREQLRAAGVRGDRIHVRQACTRESAHLPSHRRDSDGTRFACLAAIR